MNMLPLVSVLIPLYNAQQYIADTIIKIKRQTYPNIEVIIVDDHSTDESTICIGTNTCICESTKRGEFRT